MRSIRTKRLLLRRWQTSDRVPFAALNADPVVMAFFLSTLPSAESDAFVDRIEDHFDEHGFGLWAVEAAEGFLGFVGLWAVTPSLSEIPTVEIGWRLAASAWGKGYATEAARAARDDGFGRIGLPELVSFTAAINAASRAVMERIGMHHDAGADFEHPQIPPGHRLRPHVLYRMTRPHRSEAVPVVQAVAIRR